MNFNTEVKDYTNCDPDIANKLKNNRNIECKVYNHEASSCITTLIIAYNKKLARPYIDETGCLWKTAIPVKYAKKVKSIKEIFAWLEANNYTSDASGNWSRTADSRSMTFYAGMFFYCGKEVPNGKFNWHKNWLVKLPI